MTNPLTAIQAAATAAGVTASVEIGDESEINLILNDQTTFPILAVQVFGVDAERRHLRPGLSVSYYLKWECLCYLLTKSALDDTGAARQTAMHTVFDTALDIVAELQKAGSTALQGQQPTKESLSLQAYNRYDLNVDGVVFRVSIPDTYESCPD